MQNHSNSPQESYPVPLDAIVLAGTDDNPRRMIRGQNKAFLEIGGEVLVRRVVRAVFDAESIGRVFVVGPSERLAAALGDLSPDVRIVEQAGKMVANAWEAIYASEACHRENGGEDDANRPLFFISSDLPLVSAAAVDDFIARCAAEDREAGRPYSMLGGMAEESSLEAFYAETGKPGIERPYVNLKEFRIRLANLYVGRPRALANAAFLQTGFEHRKAEKWKHVLFLAWHFLKQPGGWHAAWITLRLQATLLASKSGGALYRRLRRGNGRERLERVCSQVLGGPVRMVITPYGGLSLDVDNDDDYRILSERYADWRDAGPVEPSG